MYELNYRQIINKRRDLHKIEFNTQKNISLLQDGRRFFVYSSNMAAVTSCEHTLSNATAKGNGPGYRLALDYLTQCVLDEELYW